MRALLVNDSGFTPATRTLVVVDHVLLIWRFRQGAAYQGDGLEAQVAGRQTKHP